MEKIKIIYNNGCIYKGEVKDGAPHGRGELITSGKGRYVGRFANGLPNGLGTVNFKNGNFYTGNVKDSQITGEGIMFFADGDIMIGSWVNGEMQGFGTWVNQGEDFIFQGEFVDGQPTWKGKLLDRKGNILAEGDNVLELLDK